MKNIYLQILLNRQEISGMALATVTRTSGSTPQKPGSSALFNSKGLVSGTVGGGIVEGKTQLIAAKAVQSKKSAHYLFTLDNSVSGGEDALCGGKIKVLIDGSLENHIAVFEGIKKADADRVPGILATVVKGREDDEVVINRYWIAKGTEPSLPPEIMTRFGPEIMCMLSSMDRGDFRELELPVHGDSPSSQIFFELIIPPLRLIIAGAGHIGKALSKIGQMLDFEITVIDDRQEFANSENLRFADHIITEDIGSAISKIKMGDDTFMVIVTRGHKDDANALRACIASNAAYIGMIGSRKKVALMRNDFIENGWSTEKQWNKINAPIGLDINSRTIEEIAVSIAAQLVQVRNAKR